MKRAPAALVGLAALALAACGSGGREEWAGPPRADRHGRLGVSAFDDFLSGDGKVFARSPLAAVAEFLRLDRSSARSTSLVSRTPGEARSPATVVAILDRLLDDSVRAQRYVVEVELGEDGNWRLRSAARTQRCWPGRGHQGFSTAPCV